MEFLVQHYSAGTCGWITLNGEVHYNLYLNSQMHRMYTSGERACLYDRVERVMVKIAIPIFYCQIMTHLMV